jgi:heterodisulfide reductase subunit A
MVTLNRKPRYIIEDKCTGCTTCVEYCPAEYPDQFNQGISQNKAIHIYYDQAVPLVAYIDESCLYLQQRKCDICESVCKTGAINFKQQAKKLDINVGAIILSLGLEPFDPGVRDEYGYGRMQNVITSMDFERVLSPTGPYAGELLRASDRKHPHRIAWIQCVGSRQVLPGANSYCSGVCCSYTQKQVILTKDHDAEMECTVFHNDIRAFGKDFERYYQRAAQLSGVRFIRSYVSIARECPETNNISIRYATNEDGVKEEEFDLVVLSVGFNPPADYRRLAEKFGIELNAHGFCNINSSNPIQTSRPGIFVSGAFQGPMDIPEAVFSASGAGAQSGELLDYRRGKLARERIWPQERDVSRETPRIGVFVCHCGANISRVVDVPATVAYALTLPHVVHAQEQIFSCAANSAREITEMALEKGLNRVVMSACSPRTLEPLFRDTLREAGINPYYLDMANIREHCSWVHTKEKEAATQKAKDITRMAVARACHLEPLQEIELPVDQKALVVGGGLAGLTCALSIANQGYVVHLVEQDSALGGMAKNMHYTLEGLDIQAHLAELMQQVYRHRLIQVHTGARIREAAGYVGNFITRIESARGMQEIKHGATVIAIGADGYTPAEYLYGQDDRVLTQRELEQHLSRQDKQLLNAERLVMIQCVGSRQEDRNYCSRICCSESIKHALKLKEINPGMEIYILFRDMRTYGFREDFYREAAQKGIRFIRYEPDDKPQIAALEEDGRPVLRVTVTDFILGQKLAIDADIIALAAAMIPAASTREIAGLFNVALSPDGFFKEAHVKLRPVDFSTEGVFVCGTAHYPKHIPETINQAYGAAGRAVALLSHDDITVSGSVCEVDAKKCMGCEECILACSYDAISLHETRKGKTAMVNPVICKGDGLCNVKCPTGAIVLKHFTDKEIISQIDAAVSDEEIMHRIEIPAEVV